MTYKNIKCSVVGKGTAQTRGGQWHCGLKDNVGSTMSWARRCCVVDGITKSGRTKALQARVRCEANVIMGLGTTMTLQAQGRRWDNDDIAGPGTTRGQQRHGLGEDSDVVGLGTTRGRCCRGVDDIMCSWRTTTLRVRGRHKVDGVTALEMMPT
jgi:hypothetical protein